MDGARALNLYRAVGAEACTDTRDAPTSRRAAVVSIEAWSVSLGEAATGADLGGSSKYSNENFED